MHSHSHSLARAAAERRVPGRCKPEARRKMTMHVGLSLNGGRRDRGRSRSWRRQKQKQPATTDGDIADGHRLSGLSGDEFDLREEVMACIAKSIGLHQPPLSGSDSVDVSPAFSPVGSRDGDLRDQPLNSFRSLSLLETGDDTSSATGSSVLGAPSVLGALDNEVEILHFAAGSTLARAGERHPGRSISP